jgi:S-adenosylmethionine:tRNA ribosyltransferase-isomerase
VKLTDFDFDLPEDLIAQEPLPNRSGGRLLVLPTQSDACEHRSVTDLPDLLRPGDLLVLNNTRVYPARLAGRKVTGGKVEILVERITGDPASTNAIAWCLCRASKALRDGTVIELAGGHQATVLSRRDNLFEIEFTLDEPLLAYLEKAGALPLPPYIRREVDEQDKERYQTVYATEVGAVAAPTAGLHFDEELLDRCTNKGVDKAYITLHVGAGTFLPVRDDDIENHRMHAERVRVDAALCDRISTVKREGGRVIAVGTTVVRALESAAAEGTLQPFDGDTRLFIKRADQFRVIDGMLTNFHLPKSTLLMLVCAFGGRDRVLQAYRDAVARHYRFFSYGDAMLLFPNQRSDRGPDQGSYQGPGRGASDAV